jgi:hypothetical protein
MPTERSPLVGEVSGIFCGLGCPTGPYGRILDFLDRSRYYLFQIAPQDTVPDPVRLRKFFSAGTRTLPSGSVARNSEH